MFAEKTEGNVADQHDVRAQETDVRDLTDLQLALIGGGIGTTAI